MKNARQISLFLVTTFIIGCQTLGGLHTLESQKCIGSRNGTAIIYGAYDLRTAGVPANQIIAAVLLYIKDSREVVSMEPLTEKDKEEFIHLLELILTSEAGGARMLNSMVTLELATHCGLNESETAQTIELLRLVGRKAIQAYL